MQPWSPDQDDTFPDIPEEGAPEVPIAFVSTQQTIPLRVAEVDDHRTPDGMRCMGTYFKGRLIARSVVPPEALGELESHEVFASPVRLGLAAVEQSPGLQCRLFALLPASHFEEDEPREPWLDSVPRFEDTVPETDDDEEEEIIIPILLGHIVRFKQDRKHPEDLASEAADVLRAILSEERPLKNVVDKLLEDL